MPTDLTLKAMNAVHRTVLMVTGGRIGWTVANMPALELTTTGRRSGQPRTVMLTSPAPGGLHARRRGVARWGRHRTLVVPEPLRQPRGRRQLPRRPAVPMHARVASAEERARLWPLVVADHKNYADYQTRTEREIPLVLLEPPA